MPVLLLLGALACAALATHLARRSPGTPRSGALTPFLIRVAASTALSLAATAIALWWQARAARRT